jgi:pimeloyl-ACP methyl ester carboxylesterase
VAKGVVRMNAQRRDAPLMLLPGTLCDARVFAPLAALLPDRETVVAEMTGAGSTSELASAILSAAPGQFVAVGFSLGGIVALEIAAMAPERVVGLALIASSARPDKPGGAEGRRADMAEARRRGIGPFLLEKLWPRYVATAARTDLALQRLVLDMAESLGPAVFARQTEVAISRADSRPRLAALKMPVLALCGEEDALCPPVLQHEIAEAVPNATLRIIPGAGHFVLQESPRAAQHIAAWLDTLSPA